MRVYLSLLLLFTFSCSHHEFGKRIPAGKFKDANCFGAMKSLIKSQNSIRIPDYLEELVDHPIAADFYREVIQKRSNQIPKDLFTKEELTNLKKIDDKRIIQLLKSPSIETLDKVHLLSNLGIRAINSELKATPHGQIFQLMRLIKSIRKEGINKLEYDILFRRRADPKTKRLSLDEIYERLEAFYVSPRGEAKTRAQKLKAYRVDLNREEFPINEKLIPQLIAWYRLDPDTLKEEVKRLTISQLRDYIDTARAFSHQKNSLYFFDYREREDAIIPTNTLGYVFSTLENQLRAKEVITATEVATPTAPLEEIAKITPLTTREDTFKINPQYADQEILLSYMIFQSRGNLALIGEPMQKIFMELAQVETPEELLDPVIQQAILKKIGQKVQKEDINYTLGKNVQTTKKVMEEVEPTQESWNHKGDMHRGWGWRLLREDDPIWEDPEYLRLSVRFTNAFGSGLSSLNRGDYSNLKRLFEEQWHKLSPKYRPSAYTSTGSDANNLLYHLAINNVRRRLGHSVKDAEILYFDGVYAGVRGKISGAGYHGMGKEVAPNLEAYKITNPRTYDFDPTDPDEVARVEALEDKSLQEIKEKVLKAEKSDKPIGGMFLEPISATKSGVNVYRPQYILKLQKLCNELGIDIYADEILSGGGRTGKFFAFEHYPGFEPTAITFGKGLQVSGVATKGFGGINSLVTQEVPIESLLKSYMTLKRIDSGNLIENAKELGKYMLEKIREKRGIAPTFQTEYPRGQGFMIWPGSYSSGPARGAEGRLFPFLDLTKEEIDELF